MKKKEVFNIPEDELDMFTKHGVKTIVAGNAIYKLTKKKPKKLKKFK
jgi:hypothetical protein